MPPYSLSNEIAHRALQVSQQIQPMLHGLGPDMQAAVLADLASLYFAGFQNLSESERKQLIDDWVSLVVKLIPASQAQIAERRGQS